MNFLPEKSFRAALAGLEAAILTWLTTALLAMVAYAATAGAPGMAEATWSTAVGAGTRFWALGLGGTMVQDDVTLTLIPLGITVLAVLLLRGSIRRGGLVTLGQASVAGIAFVVATAALGLAGGVEAGRHILGALLVALAAGVAALWGRVEGVPGAARSRIASIPDDVGEGFRSGLRVLGWLGVLGVLLVAGSLALSWAQVTEISDSLESGVVSTITFALVQAAFLPNLIAWALAWLAGPGFMVGTGTSYAPGEVLTEPLPAIPVFGALPAPGSEPGLIVILVPMLLGALWALWRSRRVADPGTWADLGIRVAAFLATVFLGALVWFLLAGGALGPGRMAEIGVNAPALTALILAAEVTLGYLLALVTFRLVTATARARRDATGTPVPDPDVEHLSDDAEDAGAEDTADASGVAGGGAERPARSDDLPRFGTARPSPATESAHIAPTALTAPIAASSLTAPTALTAEVPEGWEDGDGTQPQQH